MTSMKARALRAHSAHGITNDHARGRSLALRTAAARAEGLAGPKGPPFDFELYRVDRLVAARSLCSLERPLKSTLMPFKINTRLQY